MASDVDHIDGLGPLGPRGHDPDNLRSMCHPCHSKRTAADQPGGWNRSPNDRRQRRGRRARDDLGINVRDDEPW